MIFWCLFAFIGSGYEHSIANKSLMSLALFLPHGAEVSITGFIHNQIFVTAGNIVGGGLMVGMVYVFTQSTLTFKSQKKTNLSQQCKNTDDLIKA
jgi:nitrite transporter